MSKQRIFGIFILLILAAVSVLSFIRLQNNTPLQEDSKAATPEAIRLAENEYAFINQLYLKYIGDKTAAQLAEIYQPVYRNIDIPNFYRGICSMGTVNAIAKGGNLASTDQFSEYFRNKYNSQEFMSILDLGKQRGGWHVRSAAGYDCLVAASAMRNVLGDKRNTILTDLAVFTRGIESSLIQESQSKGYGNTIVDYYKGVSATNIADSQAEEANAVASLFEAASKLLPSSGSGSVSNDERTRWHNTARDLAKWSVTKDCNTCSIRNSNWLINNHDISPNPNYTLSLLTAYSELAMVSNQTGKSLPTDIFDSTVIQNLNNVGNDLMNYLSPSFGFKGNFKIIDKDGNEQTSSRFDDTRYTLTTSSVSTSFPNDSVDNMNYYLIPGSNTLKSYVQKGDYMWSYTCNFNNEGCKADYQITVNSWLRGIQRKSNNADGWDNVPLPTRIDSVNQWFKDDTTLYTFIYSGSNVWHFICTNVGRSGTTCTAENVKSLSSHWPASVWTENRDRIDAVSEFVQPGTNNLKGYIHKDNKIFAYNCDRTNYPSSCTPFFTNTLNDFWNGIPSSNVAGWNPPLDKIDAISQYYNPAGELVSTVMRGPRVWIYKCKDGCIAVETNSLYDFSKEIQYRWKWPQFPQNNVTQIVGVSDWGHDGTFQNSAFSTLYLVNNQNFEKYNQLQQEEIRRGRNTSTLPFPSDYSNNQWNYNALSVTRNAGGPYAMMDGFDNPKSPDQKVNSHWWFNFLAGKNHSMAYLALTDKKILGSFDEVLPTNTPTTIPTNSPTITTRPTNTPTTRPTNTPTITPTNTPTTPPTNTPTTGPTNTLATRPTNTPIINPTATPITTTIPSIIPCPKKPQGDANCDNIINLADYSCIVGELSNRKPVNCKSSNFDNIGSDRPTSADYTIWSSNYYK